MWYVAENDDIDNVCNYCDHSFPGLQETVWCDCYCPNMYYSLCKVCQDCKYKIQCEKDCSYERKEN